MSELNDEEIAAMLRANNTPPAVASDDDIQKALQAENHDDQ